MIWLACEPVVHTPVADAATSGNWWHSKILLDESIVKQSCKKRDERIRLRKPPRLLHVDSSPISDLTAMDVARVAPTASAAVSTVAPCSDSIACGAVRGDGR